jgi:ABC-2 type transport system permease protein
MIFLGKYEGGDLLLFMGLQVFWVFFFWGLSILLWNWAIKRLTILGG